MRADPDDFLFIKHSGRGIASWALRYFLACGPLAIFLIVPWGGAIGDPQERDDRVSASLKLVSDLIDATRHLTERHSLLVYGSDMYRSMWRPPGQKQAQRGEGAFGQVEAILSGSLEHCSC